MCLYCTLRSPRILISGCGFFAASIALGLEPRLAHTVRALALGRARARRRPAVANEIGSVAGSGSEWGEAWKDNLRNNWDSVVGIGIQGESLPYTDQFLDLDPRYRDAYGSPLLRLTFDWHDNDRALFRFMSTRCKEIMQAMGPTRMSSTPELEPYNIYSYQSTHCTGGAIPCAAASRRQAICRTGSLSALACTTIRST